MRNLHKLVWIIAVGALVIASGFCDPAPVVDPAMVGKWYLLPTFARANSIIGLLYEFKTDGTFVVGNGETDFAAMGVTFSTKNGKITMHIPGDPDTPAAYTIKGAKLTLTNPAGKTTGWAAGTFYKKSDMDPALLGKWYTTESAAKDNGARGLAYEFKDNGTYLDNNKLLEDVVFMATASDKTLTVIYADKTNIGKEKEVLTYDITGNTIKFTHISGTSGVIKGGAPYYKK